MEIVPLSAVPHFADQITEWQWRAFGEPSSRDFFASIVASSLSGADFPVTFVAVEAGKAIGTAGFWRCDLISRQDLFPWMAALYVAPDARGRGIAGQLQQHVIDYARRLGHPQLYLYSACRDFYERFGWQYIGEGLDYPATAVSLYRYDLSLSDGAITE